MDLSAGPDEVKVISMAEVSFFILGALFTFALAAALLVLLANAITLLPVAARDPRNFEGAFAEANPTPRPSSHLTGAQAWRRDHPARSDRAGRRTKSALPEVTLATAAPAARQREAYRIAAALDEADRALTRIAKGPEAAAAKIASQTLRRLSMAAEPPKARLGFAFERLQLLSLRPEPLARLAAQAALRAMA